ncbi:MAG: hypothetical protein HQK79_16125 [Desulfobacterales bacterium]|nr:hypothetical protein [Desulfobacterales bacterium]MBF0398859.1 hypothetical protein [Desulfobacterales bacterium]
MKDQNKVIIGIAVIVVLAVIITVISINKGADTNSKNQAKQEQNIIPQKINDDLAKMQANAAKQGSAEVKNQQGSVDPLLKDVVITEIPASEPSEMHEDPQKQEIKRIISVMTAPFHAYKEKLSSFACEGEMDVIVPTLNTDEKSFNQGKRYGKGIKVNSKFSCEIDENNNYHIRQETKTDQGNTKYDKEPYYNGDIYFVDGKYAFIGRDGKQLSGDDLKKAMSAFQESNNEPLVRKNWIEIVKDIDLVIGFDSTEQSENKQSFSIKPINPDMQQKTMKLDSLSGTVKINDNLMVDGNVNGKGQLKRGYMSGADVGYSMKMHIKDVGNVQPITLP